MKQTFIAMAAIALTGAAAAQGSVTVFGVLDVGLAHFSQYGASTTLLTHSGDAPSVLGFRGSEDLGGGLSAHFWLAGGLSPDDGNARGFSFNFRSTVSLASAWGEIRLGRDFPVGSLNQGVFDPFRNMGPASGANLTLPVLPPILGTGSNPTTSIRVNNSIQYLWGFAPNALASIGRGFYGDLMTALPENASGTPAMGRYAGARVGYASGPWNVAAAYADSTGPFGTLGPGYGSATTFRERNVGASYAFSDVRLMGHVGVNDSAVPNTRYAHWALGAEINVGATGTIPISYVAAKQNNAQHSSADQIGVGYVYRLSKRTALYTSAVHITNKDGATYTFIGGNGGSFPGLSPGLISDKGNATGYGVGIRHFF